MPTHATETATSYSKKNEGKPKGNWRLKSDFSFCRERRTAAATDGHRTVRTRTTGSLTCYLTSHTETEVTLTIKNNYKNNSI